MALGPGVYTTCLPDSCLVAKTSEPDWATMATSGPGRHKAESARERWVVVPDLGPAHPRTWSAEGQPWAAAPDMAEVRELRGRDGLGGSRGPEKERDEAGQHVVAPRATSCRGELGRRTGRRTSVSLMISPELRHSFLLSSSTVFMFSIQTASTGPSNMYHFLLVSEAMAPARMRDGKIPSVLQPPGGEGDRVANAAGSQGNLAASLALLC